MVVVTGIDLDKHIEVTRGIVALHHLRDLFELLEHLIEGRRILQVESDIGAGFVAYLLGIDYELRAFEYSHVCQLLYALMDCRTAYVALTCHLEERNTRILGYEPQDFLV